MERLSYETRRRIRESVSNEAADAIEEDGMAWFAYEANVNNLIHALNDLSNQLDSVRTSNRKLQDGIAGMAIVIVGDR